MKKMMKYIIACLGLVLVLTACGSNGTANKEMKKVGILQIIDHGSLDATRKGFIDELAKSGYIENENLVINYQNAQGDQANLKSMSEKLVKENDLVFAIGTPSAQALMNETKTVPIIISAVTDPVAAGLADSLEKPGRNIAGTTDMVDTAKQIELIQRINPAIKKVGLIYNASEANSKLQIDEAKVELAKLQIETVEMTVASTNDVQQSMETLVKQVEAIYIPTDNTLASSMAIVGEIAKKNKIPVIPGSGEMVLDGGLATYGVNYTDTGAQSGVMAVRLLTSDATIDQLSIESPKNLDLVINEEMATTLGINTADLKKQ